MYRFFVPLSATRLHSVKIILNGQEKPLAAPITVAALLQEMGFSERRVAVEVNREIVPRSRHGEVQLRDNDRVEVVFAIGGGGIAWR
jgi:sulfur carrier protein